MHTRRPIYSARIGLGYRALATREGDAVVWFWIGTHAETNRLLSPDIKEYNRSPDAVERPARLFQERSSSPGMAAMGLAIATFARTSPLARVLRRRDL